MRSMVSAVNRLRASSPTAPPTTPARLRAGDTHGAVFAVVGNVGGSGVAVFALDGARGELRHRAHGVCTFPAETPLVV